MMDWQQMLSRDGPAVFRTAYRLLGNQADAEECFQEVFLAALEVSRREVVHHWAALLQRLTVARAVDRLRERGRRGRREQIADWGAVVGRTPPPSQDLVDAELADLLRKALAQLPPQQAEVFCLHCLEGWSYQEVSQQIGMSIDAVGVQLYRARQRLRELMAVVLGVAPTPERGPMST